MISANLLDKQSRTADKGLHGGKQLTAKKKHVAKCYTEHRR